MNECPNGVRDGGEFGDWLHRADLIVHQHQAEQGGVWSQGGAQGIRGDRSVARELEPADFEAVLIVQRSERLQHGLMLGSC